MGVRGERGRERGREQAGGNYLSKICKFIQDYANVGGEADRYKQRDGDGQGVR